MTFEEFKQTCEEWLNEECRYFNIFSHMGNGSPTPLVQNLVLPFTKKLIGFNSEDIIIFDKQCNTDLYTIKIEDINFIKKTYDFIHVSTKDYDYRIYKVIDSHNLKFNMFQRKEISYVEYIKESTKFDKIEIITTLPYGLTEIETLPLHTGMDSNQSEGDSILKVTKSNSLELQINLEHYTPIEITIEKVILQCEHNRLVIYKKKRKSLNENCCEPA